MANKDDLLNLNTKKSVKKPLVYGAVAFLVFIIAILGFAIYNNSNSKQDSVVIPPQVQNNEEKQDNTDSMFKEVPIETTTAKNDIEEKKENLAQKLLKEENKTKPTAIQQPKEAVVTKTAVVEKTKTKPQVQTTKKATKPIKTVKPAVGGKYYIQVAALMRHKQPNKKFLNLIKKEGYNYTLYDTYYVKNGEKIKVVKLLIGPFTKTQALKELKNIKSKISQSAFIYKVK